MVALTMLTFVHGLSISSLPTGAPVTSRIECVSLCYLNTACSSVFFNSIANTCHQLNYVYAIGQETSSSSDLQYLVWISDYCPPGYIWYRSLELCYRVNPAEVVWEDAQNLCEEDGGHLISVDSPEVNDFMNWLVGIYGMTIWTGGKKGTRWTWADNSNIESTYWTPGQPGGSEYCLAVFSPDMNPVNNWHDVGCTSKYMSVCQGQGPVTNTLC